MELNDEFRGTDAELIGCIKAMLTLLDHDVIDESRAGVQAINLIEAAGARLEKLNAAPAHEPEPAPDCDKAFFAWFDAQKHQITNETLCQLIWRRAWDARGAANTAPDGIKITPSKRGGYVSGFQHYNVALLSGGNPHFYAVRVVKTFNADGPDAREVDHFAAIERRLLAGNPVDA